MLRTKLRINASMLSFSLSAVGDTPSGTPSGETLHAAAQEEELGLNAHIVPHQAESRPGLYAHKVHWPGRLQARILCEKAQRAGSYVSRRELCRVCSR